MVNKGRYWFGLARQVVQGYATQGSGTANELSAWATPFPCKIVKLSVIFDSAVTGAATNNFGVRFKNKGNAGTGTLVIATKTFSSGVDADAFDEVDLGAISNNILNEGDTVTFEKFENGSGLSMPALTAIIQYVRHR